MITEVAVPPRLANRPRDARGYVIPWNVVIGKDNTPLFTVNDTSKTLMCLIGEICPLCGEGMGREPLWFVGGPRAAFDPRGAYLDMPGHHDCIRYALQVCPYLAMPSYTTKPMEVLPAHIADKVPDNVVGLIDETMDPQKPRLFVAQSARGMYRAFRFGQPRVKPRLPILAVEYWQNGRQLEKEEGERLVRDVLGERYRAATGLR